MDDPRDIEPMWKIPLLAIGILCVLLLVVGVIVEASD